MDSGPTLGFGRLRAMRLMAGIVVVCGLVSACGAPEHAAPRTTTAERTVSGGAAPARKSLPSTSADADRSCDQTSPCAMARRSASTPGGGSPGSARRGGRDAAGHTGARVREHG
ncbi:MAG: hypothetical protein QM809_07925 [Gordonia sp. (in: high G+C Gram-positive bacteria)]|uniref:hypothetical protein n=1 Tax=Gordonia sp. (in: high G+C Gram-positive bacteria) TaxID=84139 RepID=UPI0039E3218E